MSEVDIDGGRASDWRQGPLSPTVNTSAKNALRRESMPQVVQKTHFRESKVGITHSVQGNSAKSTLEPWLQRQVFLR